MIYDYPKVEEPIRQGDIFIGLPRVDVSLQSATFVGEDGQTFQDDWDEFVDSINKTAMVVPVQVVSAIVITQDCDAIRDDDISLCEIRPLAEVYSNIVSAKNKMTAIVSILTQHARQQLKWFYLPPDAHFGVSGRHAVCFSMTIRVPRKHLEAIRIRRKLRLNEVADEHFREKLSDYFRRYPYNEWYPLNKEEYVTYREKHPDAKPYKWQTDQEVDT
jgi:hypothetical protein